MAYKCALCLSGHVRGAFDDQFLNDFIKKLFVFYDVDIYIHTWDQSEAQATYRPLDQSTNYQINEQTILKYFRYPIKKINIEKDQRIKISGQQTGFLAQTKMPIKNWKLMIYGMFSSVKMAKDSEINYDFVIRHRIDLFSRYHNKLGFRNPQLNLDVYKQQALIHRNIIAEMRVADLDEVCWLSVKARGYPMRTEHSKLYIDNYYYGNLQKIYDLLNLMNSSHLDSVIKHINYSRFNGKAQEAYFYFINRAIKLGEIETLKNTNKRNEYEIRRERRLSKRNTKIIGDNC